MKAYRPASTKEWARSTIRNFQKPLTREIAEIIARYINNTERKIVISKLEELTGIGDRRIIKILNILSVHLKIYSVSLVKQRRFERKESSIVSVDDVIEASGY